MAKTMSELIDNETARWVKWYTRPSRIACHYCIPFHAEKLGRRPDCKKCGLPTAFLMDKYFERKEETYEEITKN